MAHEEKDPRNVERGLKAAISNPHVSEQAKRHDRERLESEFHEGSPSEGSTGTSAASEPRQEEEADPANVARGLKAAINNPRVSEQAKERDQERLEELEQGRVE